LHPSSTLFPYTTLFRSEGFITDLDDFLLFCYTDGLTETLNEAGAEYGQDSLVRYFQQKDVLDRDLKTIHQDLIVALDCFKGRNRDRKSTRLNSSHVKIS